MWGNFWLNFPEIFWYNLKKHCYILLKEPFILPDIGKVIGNIPLMLRKRRQIMARRKIDANDMQKWFE